MLITVAVVCVITAKSSLYRTFTASAFGQALSLVCGCTCKYQAHLIVAEAQTRARSPLVSHAPADALLLGSGQRPKAATAVCALCPSEGGHELGLLVACLEPSQLTWRRQLLC